MVSLMLAGCASKQPGPRDASTAQAIVDEATRTLRTSLEGKHKEEVYKLLSEARGVMIVPSVGSFSLLFSVSAGNGVVMARTEDGRWNGPIFMTKGTGGLGVQAGVTNMSGLVIYMNDDDVHYMLDTGAVVQGQASITFLDKDYEGNRTDEFTQSGEIVFVGNISGLYAGIGVAGGGFRNRETLNAAYHGVQAEEPEQYLYNTEDVPHGAEHLLDLLNLADTLAAKAAVDEAKKKDGTEVPSN